MACWVVPIVAAELWDCHIDRITNAVRDGHLKTREENGWMFVDVAPDSPVMETGKALWAGSPWAAQVVSRDEMDALSEPIVVQEETRERVEIYAEKAEEAYDQPDHYEINFNQPFHSSEEDEQVDQLPALHIADEEEAVMEEDEAIADFRKVRSQVSRTRLPPMVKAA